MCWYMYIHVFYTFVGFDQSEMIFFFFELFIHIFFCIYFITLIYYTAFPFLLSRQSFDRLNQSLRMHLINPYVILFSLLVLALVSYVQALGANPEQCLKEMAALCGDDQKKGPDQCKACLSEPKNHEILQPLCEGTGSGEKFCG